jgi:hypothetical protein
MLDTKGPEIRIGRFRDGETTLSVGQTFTLTARRRRDGGQGVDHLPQSAEGAQAGRPVLLDDGLIELEVEKVAGQDIVCRVKNGGRLGDRKGVNVPDIHLGLPYMSPQDVADIHFASKTGLILSRPPLSARPATCFRSQNSGGEPREGDPDRRKARELRRRQQFRRDHQVATPS